MIISHHFFVPRGHGGTVGMGHPLQSIGNEQQHGPKQLHIDFFSLRTNVCRRWQPHRGTISTRTYTFTFGYIFCVWMYARVPVLFHHTASAHNVIAYAYLHFTTQLHYVQRRAVELAFITETKINSAVSQSVHRVQCDSSCT